MMSRKFRPGLHAFWLWLKLLWKRVDEDGMTTQAGNLAFVSLLALVPLIAVVFALLSASANTGVVVVVVPLVHTHLDLVHRYLPLDHAMFGLHEPPVWVVALVDR